MLRKYSYTSTLIYLFLLNCVAIFCNFFYPGSLLELLKEDGWAEWSTFFSLILNSILCFLIFLKSRKEVNNKKAFTTYLISGLVFFFGAGEEISWGQRIFGIETPQKLKEINLQGEVNLHNLIIGGVKVNKVLFSLLPAIIIIIYFFILPQLIKRNNFIKKMIRQWSVPVPELKEAIFLIIISSTSLILNNSRKWELLEFSISTLIFLIFLRAGKVEEDS